MRGRGVESAEGTLFFWIYMDRGDQNMVFYKDNGFIQCVEELKSTMIEKMIEEMVMTAFFYQNVLIALA